MSNFLRQGILNDAAFDDRILTNLVSILMNGSEEKSRRSHALPTLEHVRKHKAFRRVIEEGYINKKIKNKINISLGI